MKTAGKAIAYRKTTPRRGNGLRKPLPPGCVRHDQSRRLYENGRGVPQDYAKAREWHEKAAAVGNAGAMSNLGNFYRDGLSVPKDYAKAREWLEKAFAAGDIVATHAQPRRSL